jgi:hypothetical protein
VWSVVKIFRFLKIFRLLKLGKLNVLKEWEQKHPAMFLMLHLVACMY